MLQCEMSGDAAGANPCSDERLCADARRNMPRMSEVQCVWLCTCYAMCGHNMCRGSNREATRSCRAPCGEGARARKVRTVPDDNMRADCVNASEFCGDDVRRKTPFPVALRKSRRARRVCCEI